jgi:hypothetical protein
MAKKTYIEKMEEAAGITTAAATSPEPKMPYGKGEYIKSGEVARPWTGPRPWRKNVPLIPRAKGGPVSPGRSLMKMKGSALAKFMPEAKKAKRGKKRIPI